MPYIHVTAADVLSELDDDEIEKEAERRRARRGRGKDDRMMPWTPVGMAQDLRAAFYARDASRFEALLCVLDRQEKPIPGPDLLVTQRAQH